jgi:prevent-host-death family protein
MEKMISATEMVRKFSEILNSVRYRGDSYMIVRGGKPVASIGPIQTPIRERTLGELKEVLKNIPRLGDETESFENDIEKIMKHEPPMPNGDLWD